MYTFVIINYHFNETVKKCKIIKKCIIEKFIPGREIQVAIMGKQN